MCLADDTSTQGLSAMHSGCTDSAAGYPPAHPLACSEQCHVGFAGSQATHFLVPECTLLTSLCNQIQNTHHPAKTH